MDQHLIAANLPKPNLLKKSKSCGYGPHSEIGLLDQVLTIIDNQPLEPLVIGIPVSRHRSVPAPLAIRSMVPSHVSALAPPYGPINFRAPNLKPRGRDSSPPWVNMGTTEIFSKFQSQGEEQQTPPMMGPAQKF